MRPLASSAGPAWSAGDGFPSMTDTPARNGSAGALLSRAPLIRRLSLSHTRRQAGCVVESHRSDSDVGGGRGTVLAGAGGVPKTWCVTPRRMNEWRIASEKTLSPRLSGQSRCRKFCLILDLTLVYLSIVCLIPDVLKTAIMHPQSRSSPRSVPFCFYSAPFFYFLFKKGIIDGVVVISDTTSWTAGTWRSCGL